MPRGLQPRVCHPTTLTSSTLPHPHPHLQAEIEWQREPKDSYAVTINRLIERRDPETGVPYVILKAGRPDWDKEFRMVKETHKHEKIGVVFCGAPSIGAALQDQCARHSDNADGTFFQLRKENF